MAKQPTDYLAVIPIGGGSSWGRAADKEAAIACAMRALRDWDHLYDVSGIEVTVNVLDVRGYTECHWGGNPDGYVHGKNRTTGADEPIKRKIEHVTRTTPKYKRK